MCLAIGLGTILRRSPNTFASSNPKIVQHTNRGRLIHTRWSNPQRPAPVQFSIGRAVHFSVGADSMEMPYVFDHLDQQAISWTSQDRRLASVMSTYWTNFARSGDPNGPGLPTWPRFAASNGQAMLLGNTIAPGPVPDEADLRRIDRLYLAARFVAHHVYSVLTVVALSVIAMIAWLIRCVLRRFRRSPRPAFTEH